MEGIKKAAESVAKGYNPQAKELTKEIKSVQKFISSGKKRKSVLNRTKIKREKLDDLAGFKNLFKLN